jgi:predicted DNA-binding transcriptional regulator AlpA
MPNGTQSWEAASLDQYPLHLIQRHPIRCQWVGSWVSRCLHGRRHHRHRFHDRHDRQQQCRTRVYGHQPHGRRRGYEITIARATQDVHLPRWVNEPLPDLRAILSASEIARLTHRPRWLLLGLAAIGRFPKRRTHSGKPVGWHRADVLDWTTAKSKRELVGRPDRVRRAFLLG